MRTTKPIATISYNSEAFLQGKLNELVKSRKITGWHYIWHEAEEDETKAHFHVWILPSKMLQTDDIRDELREFDPSHPDKPLGCMPFTSSDFDNWYMYVIHDKQYLASKNQSRKYHYSRKHVKTSDSDWLDECIRHIDLIGLSPYADMLDAIEHGVSWEQYFRRGTIPIPQINQYQAAWFMLVSTATDRNGKEGHEEKPDDWCNVILNDGMIINADTGEIL